MIKLQQLIGLPVIVLQTGKRVGTVKDAWFDEHWQLKGLVIGYSGWIGNAMKAIGWSEVVSCGKDAVIITGKEAIIRMKQSQIKRAFYTGITRMKDLPVVTVQGVQLGRVSDVYFYPFQGTQIIGYELTDGFVSDLMEGRKWLRAPEEPGQIKLGEDAIIVPAISEAELEPAAASNFTK